MVYYLCSTANRRRRAKKKKKCKQRLLCQMKWNEISIQELTGLLKQKFLQLQWDFSLAKQYSYKENISLKKKSRRKQTQNNLQENKRFKLKCNCLCALHAKHNNKINKMYLKQISKWNDWLWLFWYRKARVSVRNQIRVKLTSQLGSSQQSQSHLTQ